MSSRESSRRRFEFRSPRRMGSTVVLSSEHGEQQKSESKLVNVVAEGIRFRPGVRAEDED